MEEQTSDVVGETIEEEVIVAKNFLMQQYRATKVMKVKKQITNRSVRILHRKFSYFVELGWC